MGLAKQTLGIRLPEDFMLPKIEYRYLAKIERIVDADTLIVLADLGFNTFKQVRCRLLDLYAPERRTELGDRITAYLTETFKDCTCTLESNKLDRYGRSLSKVQIGSLDLATHIKQKFPQVDMTEGCNKN